MEVVYRRCGGIDVHKESISVCVLLVEEGGAKKEVRRFGTMTRDLQVLSLWLEQLGVTHVAMESTGVYWKPVWNVLEGQFELLLVNAQHIKQVPGRKTDIRDCEWIADLLQHGLLRGSYVPKQEQRDLRDLTRYRVRLTEDKARLANRIQKVLEDANIKLASVATDVLGASGRSMLQAIAAGVDEPEKLAQMAR
ncbi:MAG: IS110 family transposase, partial [Candidatus Acidiferrales bacterium]